MTAAHGGGLIAESYARKNVLIHQFTTEEVMNAVLGDLLGEEEGAAEIHLVRHDLGGGGEISALSVDMGEVMVVAYETVSDQRSDVNAYIFQQPTVDDEELQLLAQLHDGHSTITLTERVDGGGWRDSCS